MTIGEPQEAERTDPWQRDGAGGREPVFNLPAVVVVLAVIMIGVHLLRSYFLSQDAGYTFLLLFAFIPAAFGELGAGFPYPVALFWTPLSYTFLHADWVHLAVNLLWMFAFGSPVARRFGTVRFLILSALCSLGGAGLHFLLFSNELVPVIGASAAVSGYMGAAARFAFNTPAGRGGPAMFRHDGPALGLIESFTNRRFLVFLAVWMGLNLVFGTGVIPLAGEDTMVAWQAHIGGFVAGIVFFSLLDPVRNRA